MDLRLWDASQAGVEVQMLSSRQQLVYGVELRAVAHVLVDIQDVGQNSEELGEDGSRYTPTPLLYVLLCPIR